MQTHPPTSSSHRVSDRLPLILFGYLLFVVYGSLVPLDFRPMPWQQALDSFRQIQYLDLGAASRADWVANLLLFTPLTFLWAGCWCRKRHFAPRLFFSALVLLLAMALSFCLEFAQLFFPPRTVSQNDLLAESLGAMMGLALWWWLGPTVLDAMGRLLQARGQRSVAEKMLWVYLLLLLGYNLLPLDLTISPVELYHKWRAGRIIILPFTALPDSLPYLVYELVTDMLIWAPVTYLLMLSGRRARVQAVVWAFGAAVVLELLQLFVFSRVTDSTDLITAIAGAWLGVFVFSTTTRTPGQKVMVGPLSSLGYGALALVAWSLVLMVIFWYPFDFLIERNFLRERLMFFSKVPFYSYYYGTEFRAITEVFHKVGFFLPVGVIFAVARPSTGAGRWQTLYAALMILVTFGLAALIEIGQVALPNKFPDSTDLALEGLGGLIGYKGALMILTNIKSVASEKGAHRSDMNRD